MTTNIVALVIMAILNVALQYASELSQRVMQVTSVMPGALDMFMTVTLSEYAHKRLVKRMLHGV